MTPTFRDVNKKYSTRYYLSLVLIDEGMLLINQFSILSRPFPSLAILNASMTRPKMRGAETGKMHAIAVGK